MRSSGRKTCPGTNVLLDLLLVYNVVNRRELAVSEDGAFYEKPLFEEKYFTERAGLADEYYHNVLVFALVEFLRVRGNRDRLRRCPDCETVFIAGPRRSKGKKCSRCAKKKGRGTRHERDRKKEEEKRKRKRRGDRREERGREEGGGLWVWGELVCFFVVVCGGMWRGGVGVLGSVGGGGNVVFRGGAFDLGLVGVCFPGFPVFG